MDANPKPSGKLMDLQIVNHGERSESGCPIPHGPVSATGVGAGGEKKRYAQIPLSYWKRYIRMLIQYGSWRKLFNLSMALLSYSMNLPKIRSQPSFLKVEISRKCEVFCRYCFPKKDDRFYPFDRFKELVDRLKKTIFIVSLHDIGEPLHHPELIRFIRYVHQAKSATCLSTTLSVEKPESFWAELAKSGLDYLVASIDGVTPEVYSLNRTKGDLVLVLSNLKKIIAFKKQHHSKLIIEWQMIDFPWNKSEQRQARRMAFKIGCDRFSIIQDASIRSSYARDPVTRKKRCLLPYLVFIVNVYNQARACYKIYDENMILGDLTQESFGEIWNGKAIIEIRDIRTIRRRPGCRTCRE